MLKSLLAGLFTNNELGDLAEALVASMVRRLPTDAVAADERSIDVLLGGLASRAAYHRAERGWGLFGCVVLGRQLRRRLKNAGYPDDFTDKAVWRITTPTSRASTRT